MIQKRLVTFDNLFYNGIEAKAACRNRIMAFD